MIFTLFMETFGTACIIILSVIFSDNCVAGLKKNNANDSNRLWRLVMDDKKDTLAKEVEDTMACSAFAEAGEPCPIDTDKKKE